MSKRVKPAGFIVLFDDDQGTAWPMQWDPLNRGAIHAQSGGAPVAIFLDRAAARRAIKISTAVARLAAARGEPANEDFTAGLRNLKIVPLVPAKEG